MREVDRQVVAVCEDVVLFVVGDREAEPLIVADRAPYIGDLEAGLMSDDTYRAAGFVFRRWARSATKLQ